MFKRFRDWVKADLFKRLLTDALGNLVRFVLLPRGNAKRLPPGHRRDTLGIAPLIQGVKFDALLKVNH